MNNVRIVSFCVVAVAGAVFALQGANVLTNSPVMSGRPLWLYIGLIMVVVGLAGLVWTMRAARSRP
jgi:uncharacterized membrane protein HdeD (DUF308 family)